MKCLACEVEGEFNKVPYPSGGRSNPLNFEFIRVCPNCGMGSVESSINQTDLDHFYASGGYWNEGTSSPGLIVHQRVQAKVRIKSIAPFMNKNSSLSILDIGAGNAFIADHLRNFFPTQKLKYVFVEPDSNLSKNNLRKNLDFEIAAASNLADAGNGFDIIFLNHVIEHVLDPIEMLDLISKKLSPNGIFYVELPRRDDLYKSDVFPHTLFFTEKSFEEIARKAKVSILNIESFGSRIDSMRSVQKRVWGRIFHHSVQVGLLSLAEFANRKLYSYKRNSDGIWLRAVLKRSENQA